MRKLKFLKNHLNNQLTRIIFVFIFVLLSAIFTIIASLVFGYIVDNLIGQSPTTNPIMILLEDLFGGQDYIRTNLWIVAIILVVLYGLSALFMKLRYVNQAIIAEDLTKNIRENVYNHLQHLPLEYHNSNKTGELVQRCTSDVDNIRRFFNGQIEEIVFITVSILFSVFIMVSINFELSLYGMAPLPVIFCFSYFFFKRIRKQFKVADDIEAKMTVDVQEDLNGVRVIKAFNREKYVLDKFAKISKHFSDFIYKMILSFGVYWSGSYMFCALGIVLMAVVGIIFVNSGKVTLGNFMIFITYEQMIVFQVRMLGRILNDMSKVTVSIDRIIEILDNETENMKDGLRPNIDGDIEFRDVSFVYPDDKKTIVLKNINLKINKGETIAILGPTGSGKSSLILLLDRLYDVTEGEIRINGYPIKSISKEHLRKNIGVVLQESFLFSKTIYENLNINHKNSNTDIERATRIASVYDVIKNFENGFDTIVGEKGVTLSGGQKQRIAIARTIINSTPILIFDDSLSAVDAKTDADIRESLRKLDTASTTIIITQRIASCKNADRIFVIEDGRITQVGNHESLLKQEGLYSRVANIQFKGMEVI